MKHNDITASTRKHIQRVAHYLDIFADNLWQRADDHDASKLVEPEASAFYKIEIERSKLVYGSDAYKAAMASIQPAIDHHYEHNDHHAEHNELLEEWRAIEGFDGYYEVSDRGRVRSVERVVERPGSSRGGLTVPERLLKLNVTPKGYFRVQLSKDGKPSNRLVHCLVAEAFIGPKPEGEQVNHKDGLKSNNQLSNLEYMTPAENMQHAYDNGLRESSAKYVVRCEELGIETVGMNKMEHELCERGHYNVTAAGIWSATIGDSSTHAGFTFTAWPIAEARTWQGINGMNLMQIVEMVCDWKAASERLADSDFAAGLEISRKRFGIDDQLFGIIQNTARAQGWIA